MKKKIMVIVILIAIGIGIYLFYRLRSNQEDGSILLSGNVEVTEVNLGFKIAGRVVELLAEEGQKVNKKDKLAALDSAELASIVAQNRASFQEAFTKLTELKAGSRSQEIEQARANVESARAILSEAVTRLEELRTGSRPQEIEQAKANVGSAEAELVKAKRDYTRAEILYKNGAISASQYDAARSVYDTRSEQQKNAVEKLSLVKEGPRREEIEAQEHRVRQARSSLVNSQERLSLTKEGPRKEEIQAQGYRVEQAKAALATAEERLKDTVIQAPMSGVILKKNVEIGETVAQGISVYTLGDYESPWIKVYLKEDKLGLVKLGQKAKITVDSYPGKAYEGTVTYISPEAEFTPKNVQTWEERVKLVFGVKVSVPNSHLELKPGMPADVRISVQ